MATPESGEWKIFPRNLTAQADFLVRGNPASTRPESGVDNCYPGLEFDQRNLDKAFFPGLNFEFQRSDGAIVQHVLPGSTAAAAGLTDADLPLYLWAVLGRTTADQSDENPPGFFFYGLDGLEVWRRVHDLLPGRIAVLLGPAPGFSALPADISVIRLLDQFRDTGDNRVQRDGGSVAWAILTGERARYLDDDGVIDVETYPPGELTRSLCAPWQYDFRDCGCFYWAASKPDLVTSADGQHENLNFQRRDRSPTPDTPVFADRRALELDYGELIEGWNDLPVVVNDRETDDRLAQPVFTGPLLDRDQVVKELAYLATVEHSLCVEYLYAHYSLAAPMVLEDRGVTEDTRRIFAAANEVFSIAVDEMRHLRWVNEALGLLGEPQQLGRAERIGRQFDRPFALAPLTPEQLQWFIDVEAPSQAVGQGVDGMYVRLHASVERQPDQFEEPDRLVHLLKLIIDEGQDHYLRFLSIQRHLSGMEPATYLRELSDPPPDDTVSSSLQRLSDQNYELLLGALQTTFALGDRAAGTLLEQSRRAMFNLHEANHLLAARGAKPRFTLPTPPTAPLRSASSAHAFINSLAASTRATLSAVATAGGRPEQELAARQRGVAEELFEALHHHIEEDLGE